MPKAFCIAGAVVAILLLLVFGVDLAIGFPFDRQGWPGMVMDICMVLCAGMLGYISWATFRTLK
jgi:TRAP-type C4-dicarboxylate transport system permease small subunit